MPNAMIRIHHVHSDTTPLICTSVDQRCYSYIRSTNNTQVLPSRPDDIRDENMCSCENVWLAISIVFIILFLIFCGLGGIMLYKYRNLLRSTPGQEHEGVPLIVKGKGGSKGGQEIAHESPLNPVDEDKGTNEADEGGSKGGQEIAHESPLNSVDEDKGTNEADEENSWVYSIYFEDKYYGMAYLNPKYPEDIISLGNHEIIGALVKKNGEVIEFGDKARKMFTDNETDCRDYTFLDHDNLNMEYWNNTISKLDSMKVIDVYQNIIGFLVKKIYKEITGRDLPAEDDTSCCESGSCMLCNMHCVITVPNHWKDDVIPLREAFDKTMKDLHEKVKKERLHIKSREVAISPYIHEVKASVICLNFNVANLTFKENTTYANLHVGTKYCNLTFLKSENSKRPDTIIDKPHRQKWRIETTPEDQFVKLFTYIVTPNIFYEWKTNFESEYVSLLCLLEDRKNKMRENMDENEKYEFQLPSKLTEFLKEDKLSNNNLEDRVAKYGGEVRKTDSQCTIIFRWSLLKTYFTHVRDSTKDIIEGHKEKFENRKVHCVIMTGSYSQMKLFLHEAEKEWFKEICHPVTVVVPVHIGSTYAMGAAYFFKKYPKWISYDLIK